VPLAFASVSNAVIIGLLTAGSGFAVPNFKAAKNFGLSPRFESRTALGGCRSHQTADNSPRAVHEGMDRLACVADQPEC
jgi:hypothetical protein